MQLIQRKFIDWGKTGRRLARLRETNINLRRYVCSNLRHKAGNCSGECLTCEFDMDNHISRKELATIFGVSESVIFNWENARTEVSLEDMLFYAQISKIDLIDLIVFI